MPQCSCCLYSALTNFMRGEYVSVCIFQFPPSIPDMNKYMVSDQTCHCSYNSYKPGNSLILLNTLLC